jgi:hypothetical protein
MLMWCNSRTTERRRRGCRLVLPLVPSPCVAGSLQCQQRLTVRWETLATAPRRACAAEPASGRVQGSLWAPEPGHDSLGGCAWSRPSSLCRMGALGTATRLPCIKKTNI